MIERYIELLKMPFYTMTRADLDEQHAIETMMGDNDANFINSLWSRGHTNEQILERYRMYRSLLESERLRDGGTLSRAGVARAQRTAQF